MATTTPNFGWAVPTSTDLVKDGAVAIETLGDSIDASLVDLKGGTTGQVLAKATNTNMDFTWTTPASGSTFVGCSLYKSANQSINNATRTTITWNSEQFDTNTFHDNATNNSRITIPSGKAGYYLFTLILTWGGGGGSIRNTQIWKNGSAILDNYVPVNTYTGDVMIPLIVSAAVNDYYEITVYHDNGSAMNVVGGSEETLFQCQYLGA